MKVRPWFIVSSALALSACAPDDWSPDVLAHGSGSQDDEVLEVGRESYQMYCSGCHGIAGDGEGVSARFLDPKPRDFRKGQIKFALVASGQLPNDDDIARVITDGLKGTAMPAFPFIPEDEKRAIIAYIKTFSEVWATKGPGATLGIPADPYRKRPDKGVQDGERMYHGLAACHSCHPAYALKADIPKHMAAFDLKFQGFRDNMYQPEPKDSDWGVKITPPDFLKQRIKTGSSKEDIIRVVAAGVGGTAMPTWSQTLNAKQLWSLAYYVEHLASMRGMPEGRALREQLANQPPFVPPPPQPEPEPAGEGGTGGSDGAGGAAIAHGGSQPDNNDSEGAQ